jgi:hypothetical protein
LKDILEGLKPMRGWVRCLVRIPFEQKVIGVIIPKMTGTQVGMLGASPTTEASVVLLLTIPDRLMTMVQMTIENIPRKWKYLRLWLKKILSQIAMKRGFTLQIVMMTPALIWAFAANIIVKKARF